MNGSRTRVALGSRSYTVHTAAAGARFVAARLAAVRRPLVFVTDRNVARFLWPAVDRALREAGVRAAPPLVLPAGEASKSPAALERLWRALLARGTGRDACIVALGGGTVGDLAGFAAATYMRGVEWVAVPTTLLAMVDASVGGKTGVNLAATKNIVGAFHQPLAVVCATRFLASLPVRERRSGLGEVVKYAMIADAALFRLLEREAREWRSPRAVEDAALVARCVRIKARFVAADERESGIRAALNFGHTIGHALEGDGTRGLRHGEAVGLGMLAACDLAAATGAGKPDVRARLSALLAGLGLPVRHRVRVPVGELRRAWTRDKKARGGKPRFVLTPRIGAVSVGSVVPDAAIVRALQGILDPHPRTRSRRRPRNRRRRTKLSRSTR